MTPTQIDMARHALGLPNRNKLSYRNYYVTGPGSTDHDEWLAMVAAGYAERRDGSPLTGGADLFFLTRVGAAKARKRGERVRDEDVPPQREGVA